jgi:hypothetical protein
MVGPNCLRVPILLFKALVGNAGEARKVRRMLEEAERQG